MTLQAGSAAEMVVEAPDPAPEPKRLRMVVLEWMRAFVANVPETSKPDLLAALYQHFDADFFAELGRQEAGAIVSIVTQRGMMPSVIAKKLNATELVKAFRAKRIDEKWIDRVRLFFEEMREQVSADRKVVILDATKKDLHAAERIRRLRGAHEIRLADWLHELSTKLKGGQKVRDVWTVEELFSTYNRRTAA